MPVFTFEIEKPVGDYAEDPQGKLLVISARNEKIAISQLRQLIDNNKIYADEVYGFKQMKDTIQRMEKPDWKVIMTYKILDRKRLDEISRLGACTDSRYRINNIQDFLWQSQIFSGLDLERIEAGIDHRCYQRTNTISGHKTQEGRAYQMPYLQHGLMVYFVIS